MNFGYLRHYSKLIWSTPVGPQDCWFGLAVPTVQVLCIGSNGPVRCAHQDRVGHVIASYIHIYSAKISSPSKGWTNIQPTNVQTSGRIAQDCISSQLNDNQSRVHPRVSNYMHIPRRLMAFQLALSMFVCMHATTAPVKRSMEWHDMTFFVRSHSFACTFADVLDCNLKPVISSLPFSGLFFLFDSLSLVNISCNGLPRPIQSLILYSGVCDILRRHGEHKHRKKNHQRSRTPTPMHVW